MTDDGLGMLSLGKCLFWLAPSEDTVSCGSPRIPFLVGCLLSHPGAVGLLRVQPARHDFPRIIQRCARSLAGWGVCVALLLLALISQVGTVRWTCSLNGDQEGSQFAFADSFPNPSPLVSWKQKSWVLLSERAKWMSQQVPFYKVVSPR